ncbi:MAG: DUF3127 domain-containing protein [Bacteroidales bacterium]|nr:DUF3127 domain-containing protein [Bacteroidales bacterium]
MASFEIEGRIQQKFAKQQGQSARGSWSKQDFLLEYQDGSFPASVIFTMFGDDKVAELARYNEGDTVKVSFNIRAREYNGRWYNDVRAWRLSAAGQAPAAGQPAPRAYQQPAQVPPAPGLDDLPAGDDDSQDLPF